MAVKTALKSQPSFPWTFRYAKTSIATASGKPTSMISTKKPMIQVTASAVRRMMTSRGWSVESWKSAAAWRSPRAPKALHSASAAARQKSGMPMTSGKSFAFHGQSSAEMVPQPASSMMAIARAREARLCMRAPARAGAPGLECGIADDADGDREQHEHNGPCEPGRLVARDGNVEVVLGDLAEHQSEHERRARPAGEHHEVAD